MESIDTLLEKMSEEELKSTLTKINNLIVKKQLPTVPFKKGEKVFFKVKKTGEVVEGTILRINIKTVTVNQKLKDSTMKWYVSPSLLKRNRDEVTKNKILYGIEGSDGRVYDDDFEGCDG